MRKPRGGATNGLPAERSSSAASLSGPCVVCGMSDARGLVDVDLAREPCVTLCGSHELMHRRSGWKAETVGELQAAFGDRRAGDRRGGSGEIDELADALAAAFATDRRRTARRAS